MEKRSGFALLYSLVRAFLYGWKSAGSFKNTKGVCECELGERVLWGRKQGRGGMPIQGIYVCSIRDKMR